MDLWLIGFSFLLSVGCNLAVIAFKNGRAEEKLANLSSTDAELKATLEELRKTTIRLGNELSRLIGQLEGENHGRNSDSKR